ncbi:MAG: zf-HC2 domain-containing protein [Actinomycetota bacterium]
MNCLAVREHLPELAMGVLPEGELRAVESHLQWCAGCRKEATELGQAAATVAYALAPARVPQALGDRVVSRVREAAGAPGTKRRVHTVTAVIVAAVVAVAGLGWGAVMAGRADRFADRARRAELRRAEQLEQFQRVLAGREGTIGTRLPENQTHLGQLAPTPAAKVGGGAVLQLVSPSKIDFVIVIVSGLRQGPRALPYRITLQNSSGDTLRSGRIRKLDKNGGAEVFHQFQNRSLAGYTRVFVTDASGRVVLRGTVDQTSAS